MDTALSEGWGRYYAAAGQDPRPTLLAALERFEKEAPDRERLAVDLGCGTGRDTLELLRRGWRVRAIDAQIEAIESLRQRAEGVDSSDRLETVVADFETARWPSVDLVNASYSLPFCPPRSFARLWGRIAGSLPPGGRFCGQLFGDRDEWALSPVSTADWSSSGGMTFHTRPEVDMLLRGFETEQLIEVDEDGTTAVGDAKHWHLFHVVAKSLDR